jgi:hypothetical protein
MKKFLIVFLGLLILIFLFIQFGLEPLAKRQINSALAQLDGYNGSVSSVDIGLIGGNYAVDSLVIFSEKEAEGDHLFAVDRIETRLIWSEIWKGNIVGALKINRPVVNFISDGEKVDDAETINLKELLNEVTPFKIESLVIENGEIHYKDPTSSPKIDVYLRQFQVYGENLGNIQRSSDALPSRIEFSGVTIGEGDFEGNLRINLMKEIPDFDLEFKIDSLKLIALNDFTDAYANFTFEEGFMFLSSELAMKDSNYEGYVKPIFEQIKILDPKDKETSFLQKAWEGLLELTTKIFENPDQETFATRVPFEGTISENDTKLLETIFNVLRNAFVEAFTKDVDGLIDFDEVGDSKNE